MHAGANGHTLESVEGMLSDNSGIASARFNGVELRSAFLPIFSLPHKKAIGFDARLRTTDDHGGKSLATETLFIPTQDYADRCLLELLGATIQVHNFFCSAGPTGLLFLNINPEVLLDSESTAGFLAALFRRYRVPRDRVAIDVPASLPCDERLRAALDRYRKLGCQVSLDDVAIDDLDQRTIWQSGAAIARMQRSVVGDATTDEITLETLPHVVSVLHEAQMLVLMKGVDTRMEARIAIEADADLAYGLYFGTPQENPAAFIEPEDKLNDMWQAYKAQSAAVRPDYVATRELSTSEQLQWPGARKLQKASATEINRYREARRPFVTALRHVANLVMAGHRFETACDEFLTLPGAIRCYLLDSHGRQDGNAVAARHCPDAQRVDLSATVSSADADWSRREYFRRALAEPEIVQVTRQYCSLGGYTHCVTFSIATLVKDEALLEKTLIVCGDVDWSMHLRPNP